MQQSPTIPQPGKGTDKDADGIIDEPQIMTSNRPGEGLKSVISTILILAAAPIVAWLMITFIFQSYEVDGPSMETTLQDKDRLIVLKTGKTWSEVTNRTYEPGRYEIVVFHKFGLAETGTTHDKQLIKRVIGIAGDRVVVKDGKITIYNKQNPTGFDPDANQDYAKSIVFTSGNLDLTVPDGEVFVVGDNRGNSLDSRVFGTISTSDVVGELVFRLFPVNKAESF